MIALDRAIGRRDCVAKRSCAQINVEDLRVSSQSVSRTSLLLPMSGTTGSIWMLDNVDN